MWPLLSASLAAVTKVDVPSHWGPVSPLRRACPSVLKAVRFAGGLQMGLVEGGRALALLLLPPPLLGHPPQGSQRPSAAEELVCVPEVVFVGGCHLAA